MKKKIAAIIIIAALASALSLPLSGCGGDEEPAPIYAYYSPGDFFVTNVNGTNNLLKTAVVLVLNVEDAALQEEMSKHNARIRDTIIFLLRDLGLEEIQEADNKDKLREDIKEQLNNLLGIDNIVDVVFADFVMQ